MLRAAESIAPRTQTRPRRPRAAIRLLRLRPIDVLLTAVALVLVLVSHLIVGLVSFSRWYRWVERLARRPAPIEASSATAASSASAASSAARAIARAARRVPRTRCLVQAVAAMILFRGLGLEPELHIGARVGPEGMEAHAWVVSHGIVRVGRLPDLHTFARFPFDRRSPL